jgi:hypothetical protein
MPISALAKRHFTNCTSACCSALRSHFELSGINRGYSAQVLFAAPYCEVLQDPVMMAQVDKTLDFCAG